MEIVHILLRHCEDTVARSEVATGAAFWVNDLPGGPISSARVRHTLITEDMKRLGIFERPWDAMADIEKPGEKYGKIWENRWKQLENSERFRDLTMIRP